MIGQNYTTSRKFFSLSASYKLKSGAAGAVLCTQLKSTLKVRSVGMAHCTATIYADRETTKTITENHLVLLNERKNKRTRNTYFLQFSSQNDL